MPFDSAESFGLGLENGPDPGLVEAAVAGFKSSHPYLVFRKRAVARMRRLAERDPRLEARFERSLSEAGSPPPGRDLRAAIKRRARCLLYISFIALAAEAERTRRRATAAARDALAAFARAESWRERPVIRSFLDCAEIAIAVSLAYDWLFDQLPLEERRAVEQAILRHVLQPALAAYQDRSLLWPRRRDNCAAVSNAGILIAALAVLRPHPTIAARVVQSSLASAWNVCRAFAPDGAWLEGLSYWSLVVRHTGLMVAALESTLGRSFGLAERPGLAQTGDFALHAVGTSGLAFNFGDSERAFDLSPLAWLAHRFARPIDGWLLGDYDGWQLPFLTIWPNRRKAGPAALGLPTGKVFGGFGLACFRSTWRSHPQARPVYLAVKGGNLAGAERRTRAGPEDVTMHAQADAGTFVVDGARRRWVIDLGSDDYDLPGYFDHGPDGRAGSRWRYYRAHAAGHNTLVIGGANQVPDARVEILGSCVEGDVKWVVLDLSAAYGRPFGAIRRGAALIGREVVIQDEVAAGLSEDIVWAVHTTAEPVLVRGGLARLALGDDRLVARILEPQAARFELTRPPPPGSFPIADVRLLHSRPGLPVDGAVDVSELPRREDDGEHRAGGAPIRRLQIIWPPGARRLTVLLLPDSDEEPPALPVAPLDDWLARRPVRLSRCAAPQPICEFAAQVRLSTSKFGYRAGAMTHDD